MDMAKTNRTLNEAINELMKNYESALKEAVEYASNKAVEDIYKKSMSCLERYYDSYDPTSYERTDTLWHAIVPYLENYNSNKGIVSRVGVEYNPWVLEQYIQNNPAYLGSNNYGTYADYVDPWYVIENYLAGIHPATNGKNDPDKVIYYENVDAVSPTETMSAYLDKYATTTFNNNILVSFAKQIARMK